VQPKIYHADEHEIDPDHIDADALTILTTLRKAGHIAYLVGGGVRDLLAKLRPKDFDISTSASPEEIKRLFSRQCLLIGRRFRLAHIRFGSKVFEVSTFRSGESGDDLIIRDNQWGTPEEDARRRDFTINGLFLDPGQHQVIDFVGGWEDIHARILRTIGDPTIRFRQDPVRMIRLLKFRARFGFDVEPETKHALHACKGEILKSAPARVLEELLRMLESGAASAFFEQLSETGLLTFLLPWMTQFLKTPNGSQIFTLLQHADQWKNEQGKPLDRAVVAAGLLFPILEREMKIQFEDKGKTPHMGDITSLTHALVHGVERNSFPPFTKRMKYAWNFILSSQYRFEPLVKKVQPRARLLRHADFPQALAFLKLRALGNPTLNALAEEWTLLDEQYSAEGSPRDAPPEDVVGRPRHRRRPRSQPRSLHPQRQSHGR
jgi:poly(A) polymerase